MLLVWKGPELNTTPTLPQWDWISFNYFQGHYPTRCSTSEIDIGKLKPHGNCQAWRKEAREVSFLIESQFQSYRTLILGSSRHFIMFNG